MLDEPLSTQSVPEQWWVWYFDQFESRSIATGVLLLLVHESVYFGRSLPWMVLDWLPFFKQYKIQPNRAPSAKQYWECLRSVLISHFLVQALPIFGFYPLCEKLGIDTGVPFPTFKTMASQIAVFFVLEDTWHYWGHRALHWKYLYKNIHKQHHKYAAPFGLTAEYAHPVEVAFTGMGTVGSPILVLALTKQLHIITVIIWITLRLLQAIDSHSGYDFPWSLRHLLPFWSGAEHHDAHHKYFTGNYASSFRWWDYFLGTETNETKSKREKWEK